MKTIKVVAAVICDNMKEKNKIFATARGYGELKGGWEFPGGKIEAGETPQEASVFIIMIWLLKFEQPYLYIICQFIV